MEDTRVEIAPNFNVETRIPGNKDSMAVLSCHTREVQRPQCAGLKIIQIIGLLGSRFLKPQYLDKETLKPN